jgi:hypothetical protein
LKKPCNSKKHKPSSLCFFIVAAGMEAHILPELAKKGNFAPETDQWPKADYRSPNNF